MLPRKVLLSSAYFAPIEYFAALDNADDVIIEFCEHYQKQSYRTRCHILTGSGILVLNIPVLRSESLSISLPTHKLPISEIQVDYTKPWVIQHQRALEAAYGNSPFFEYYKDELFEILDSKISSLFQLNRTLTDHICNLCGIKKRVSYTTEYMNKTDLPEDILDLRDSVHPKVSSSNNLFYSEKPYYQVFTQKFGFTPNLSILDLLFNEGPNTISYL